jgi:Ca-activated chloride channel homolog
MIWRAIQFDWPSASILLPFIVGIAWTLFFLYHNRQKKLRAFAQPSVLNVVVEKREPIIFWIKVFLYCVAWLCGVLALMQPKGNERYVSTAPNGQVTVKKQEQTTKNNLRRKAHDVIFLIDASASMQIADISEKTRLDASKEIVDDVIRRLKGETVALFAFTSATMQIVPSTLDYLFTRLMLQQIDINEGETEGTDIKQALAYLRKIYFAKTSSKTKTLIILSDGGDTRLMGLSSDKLKQAIADIVSPIADAEEKNLRVFVVGLGSAQGKDVPGISFQGHPVISTLEEPLLRKLSRAGRGDLFSVGTMTPFQISQTLQQHIAQDESFIDASVSLTPPDRGDETRVYDLYFQIPLGIAILALMGCLLIPDTIKRTVERRIL